MFLPINQCCFYCKYFSHDNPDDDICKITNEIVYLDTSICDYFESSD